MFSLVNGIGHSLFEELKIEVNEKLVTRAQHFYPYVAFTKILLSSTREAQVTKFEECGYCFDGEFAQNISLPKPIHVDLGEGRVFVSPSLNYAIQEQLGFLPLARNEGQNLRWQIDRGCCIWENEKSFLN